MLVTVQSRPSPSWQKSKQGLMWFVLGGLVGGFLLWTQAIAVGGWTGLLAVGEDSLLRPLIELELTNLVLVPGEGNDGQIYYAIAIDPWGQRAPELLPDPVLRYQRIVYPVLASLGGLVSAYPLLWSMITLSILGFGLSTLAVELIRSEFGLSRWVQAGVLLNPGIWLSVRQLTPDIFGLGVSLLAVAWMIQGKWAYGVVAFVFAGLTKEALVLFAAGVVAWLVWQRRYRLALLAGGIPAVAIVAWSLAAKQISGGTGRIGGGNSSLPFKGIIDASSFWPTTPTREQVMTAIAICLMLIGLGAFLLSRSVFARCLLLPWLILPLVASDWVWRYGNASLRNFAPIGVLAAIALAGRRATPDFELAPV